MDIWTKKKRSEVMSHIRSKNTKPELILRSLVHSLGFRYRLHCSGLPGSPDLVFRKFRTVIFVHGCFWHLHKGCRDGTIPKTQADAWSVKLLNNVRKDKLHMRRLRRMGWRVLTIWECQIEKQIGLVKDRITRVLNEASLDPYIIQPRIR
jgi:DNA mismatch endonuclease (patch repair protein)